jgi:hypothetical protein
MQNKKSNKTIRKNVYINKKINLDVLKFAEENQFKYSESINILLDMGLEQTDLDKDMAYIKNKINFIASKVVYNQKLLEQIFSDFDIELNTNPDTNEYLKKFGKQFDKEKLNE